MAFFRQWLLSVIACAMLAGAARQLCPEGSMRALARFTGALLLLLAMLRPLGGVEPEPFPIAASGYREAIEQLELELGAEGEKALADGIASKLEAYIEDKAEALGADVRADVDMERRGGAAIPARVTLRGAYCEALAEWIASELGVAKEKQTWIENGPTGR